MEQIVDYKWSGCGLLVFYKVYLKVSALVSSYFQTNFTIPDSHPFNSGFSQLNVTFTGARGWGDCSLCIVWIHNLLFLKTTILTFPRVIPGFLVWFLSRETLEQSQVGRLLNIINSPTCLRYKSIGPFFFLIWIILQFILMCIVVKSIATWLKSENIFLFATPSPPHDVIRNLIFGLNGSNFDLLRTINSGKKCFDQTWDLPPFSASNWFSGNCHRGNISRNTISIS